MPIIEIQDMDGNKLFDWKVNDGAWSSIWAHLESTNKTLSEFIHEVVKDYISTDGEKMCTKNDEYPLYVYDFSHPEFCYAQVDLILNGQRFLAEGYARRHPDDKVNEEVGLLLAYSRAFDSLSKKLARQGNGLVKHHDDMRARNKELAKARAKESKKSKKKARFEPELTNKSKKA